MDSNLNNQNDQWELNLDIDDFDLRLKPVLRRYSGTRVETSTTTQKPVRIILGPTGDIKNFLNNGKLDQVVAIVKSCFLKVIGDLTMTIKDLSGVALILANVSVFSPKPSMHYLNITMRNVVKVFHKDTVPESGSARDSPRSRLEPVDQRPFPQPTTAQDRDYSPLPHPEIDTYRAKFKSEFLNQDMKGEFSVGLGHSANSELFALACGPTSSPSLVNSCIVNGVRFIVHNRDERRTTQNNAICSPGEKEGEMCYGQLDEILEFLYMSFKVCCFKLSVKQVFYLEDMAKRPPNWKVVQDVNHKKFLNGGVIVVEDDHDVIHFDNSSDLALSTSLNDLDFATLNIDGQSMDVDAPPDIIDVDEDDDLIIDEDTLPRDLADSDDEDLFNDDDDDVVVVYSSKEED
nr:hypothetical protein [Tanacetum cinerariifolium]